MEEEPLDWPRPRCDSLALAMCDPGLKRRYSSECEEDSLPDSHMDSGRSTLRGSHRGYDGYDEDEVKGQGEEEEEEEENDEDKRREDEKEDSVMEDDSDTDVRHSPQACLPCPVRPSK